MIQAIQIVPWADCTDYWAYQSEVSALSDKQPAHGLAVAGATPALDRCRSILMLSRLPRGTRAEEAWLSAVRRAIDYLIDNRGTIITSVGTIGWDYTTWYASRQGAMLWVVLQPDRVGNLVGIAKEIEQHLDIDVNNTTYFLPVIEARLPKEYRMHLRDKTAFQMTHERYPIALRRDSAWNSYKNFAQGVSPTFQVEYPRKIAPQWLMLKARRGDLVRNQGTDLLIHWTRGAYGPWPGETDADYFAALTEAESGNPRDGLATLERIVTSGVLRGEGRMIRESVPVISFSSLNPKEAIMRIMYRSTLGHWNYEPYGIGLPRSVLESLGTRQVIYGGKKVYNKLSSELKPYYQFASDRNDWRQESEWRLTGDLDLASLSNEVTLLVPSKVEMDRLHEKTGYRVVSLTE